MSARYSIWIQLSVDYTPRAWGPCSLYYLSSLASFNAVYSPHPQNLERRRNKDDEADYEAPDVDDLGNMRQGDLLKKYDEELTGPKLSSFRLGRKGNAIVDKVCARCVPQSYSMYFRFYHVSDVTRGMSSYNNCFKHPIDIGYQ